MRLVIANFDCQNIVSKDQVVAAVRRLPESHYSGLQAIRYDPKRTLAAPVFFLSNKPSSRKTQGLYYHERDLSVIILFGFRTIGQFYHVLYHEIGHFVFLKTLDQEQRDEWFSVIRPQEQRFLSEAAQQNSREDFAETYAFYCANPSVLTAMPKKAAFRPFGGIRSSRAWYSVLLSRSLVS